MPPFASGRLHQGAMPQVKRRRLSLLTAKEKKEEEKEQKESAKEAAKEAAKDGPGAPSAHSAERSRYGIGDDSQANMARVPGAQREEAEEESYYAVLSKVRRQQRYQTAEAARGQEDATSYRISPRRIGDSRRSAAEGRLSPAAGAAPAAGGAADSERAKGGSRGEGGGMGRPTQPKGQVDASVI